MHQTQPLTTYDVVNLLKTIQPLARLIQQEGPAYRFDEQTQEFLGRLIEEFNRADFSTPALALIHHSAGLTNQEMKALWNWYSYHRAQTEAVPRDGQVDMEAWLAD